MIKKKYVTYEQAKRKQLMAEADVLLFRGTGLGSWFIRRAGEGRYNHVALATWNQNLLECVEFKEWKGGRVVSLRRYVEDYVGEIDVYRPNPAYITHNYDAVSNRIEKHTQVLQRRAVTNCMRLMTGLPYGWNRIWWIAKHKLFLLRLLYNIDDITKDMPADEVVYPVCSTSVAHCFNSNGYDLVKNRSDVATDPNDIARSPMLSYLFTLGKKEKQYDN